jgi:hypothetical protein
MFTKYNTSNEDSDGEAQALGCDDRDDSGWDWW